MSYSGTFHYRAARDTDIPALMHFVPETLQGAWSFEVLQRLLLAHKLRVLEGDMGLIVGFAEFSIVLDESELMSLAVHPAFQRQGLGTFLLNAVLQEAAALGVVKMLLEVRESNQAARQLYERHGFVQDGIRRGYYAAPGAGAPREDACLYSSSLGVESSSRA